MPRAAGGKSPGNSGMLLSSTSDLSDLFDELTPTDLETRSQRDEAAANTPPKADPLAAYRPPTKGHGRSGSSKPKAERPIGLTILAVLAILGAVAALGAGILAFASPNLLQQGPDPSNTSLIKLEGAFNIGFAVLAVVLVITLVTPQPWAWWSANIIYSFYYSVSIVASGLEIYDGGNTAFEVGQIIGNLIGLSIFLYYLSRDKPRAFFQIDGPKWVGPLVSIPAGLLIAGAVIFGIGFLYVTL